MLRTAAFVHRLTAAVICDNTAVVQWRTHALASQRSCVATTPVATVSNPLEDIPASSSSPVEEAPDAPKCRPRRKMSKKRRLRLKAEASSSLHNEAPALQPREWQASVVQHGWNYRGVAAASTPPPQSVSMVAVTPYASLPPAASPASSTSLASIRSAVAARRRRAFIRAVTSQELTVFRIPPVGTAADIAAVCVKGARTILRLAAAAMRGDASSRNMLLERLGLPADVVDRLAAGSASRTHMLRQMSQQQQRDVGIVGNTTGHENNVFSLALMLHATPKDVETYVWDNTKCKYPLKSPSAVTCLVPFRVSVNWILRMMPVPMRRAAMAQLRDAEVGGVDPARTMSSCEWTLIQYHDPDMYVKTSLMRFGDPRTPVAALLGTGSDDVFRAIVERCVPDRRHSSTSAVAGGIQGVTVPLAALGSTAHGDGGERGSGRLEASTENSGVKTTTLDTDAPHAAAVSVVHAPSHRVFMEMRLHVTVVADIVWLVVPLQQAESHKDTQRKDWGSGAAERYGGMEDEAIAACISPTTREAIKVALNVDRPVVVLFTIPTSPRALLLAAGEPHEDGALARLQGVLHSALEQLSSDGLDVDMVNRPSDILDRFDSSRSSSNTATHGDYDNYVRRHVEAATLRSADALRQYQRYFRPRSEFEDPSTFRGTTSLPSLVVRRRCFGLLCIVPPQPHLQHLHPPTDLGLLRELTSCLAVMPPRAAHDVDSRNERGAVQAFVLEATKQAHDPEGLSSRRATLEHDQQRARRRRESRRSKKMSLKAQLIQTQRYFVDGKGATSSESQGNPYMFLTVVVRSGTLRRGTCFIADQCVGIVEDLLDVFGQRLPYAKPGTVAVIVDRHNRCGCPGPSSHVISMPTSSLAAATQTYRLHLQRYVEVFPHLVELLRPRQNVGGGKSSSSFAFLGNYGQSRALDYALGSQLVFGGPPPSLSLPTAAAVAAPAGAINEGRETLRGEGAPTAIATQPMMSKGSDAVGHAVDETSPEFQDAAAVGQFFKQLRRDEEYEEITAILSSGSAASSILPHSASLTKWRSLREAYVNRQQESGSREGTAGSTTACVGVLLKVDGWHTARVVMREIQKLGFTSSVRLEVIMCRFGKFTVEDFLLVSGAVRVVVCFRTPRAESSALDNYIQAQSLFVVETDDLSQVQSFVMATTVALHEETMASAASATTTADAAATPSEVFCDDESADPDHRGHDSYLRTVLLAGTGLTPREIESMTDADKDDDETSGRRRRLGASSSGGEGAAQPSSVEDVVNIQYQQQQSGNKGFSGRAKRRGGKQRLSRNTNTFL